MPILFMMIVVLVISIGIGLGVRDMMEEHPDYKGEDMLDENEDKNKMI